jgi:hypothetical protein
LYEALEQDSTHFSTDDWRSLLIQLGASLFHMQQSMGLVLFDTNLHNVMIVTLDAPVSFSYQLAHSAMRTIVTPPSRLVVKWMDTSSCLLRPCFDSVEWRRACASRLWFNRYIRAHYDLYSFCVPTSVIDWLNVLTSLLSMAKSRKSATFFKYFSQLIESSLCIAFSHAYSEPVTSQDSVRQLVKADQINNACWTLPDQFYELDGRVMEAIVCSMFPTSLAECHVGSVYV